ncbi:MAG TPA: HAD family hydrolase [Clostridiaceae bacterium]|nr:HAD family hydrolase [Clostridiaceae bacterium]
MKKMLVSDYDDTFYTDEESVKKNVSKVKKFKENGNLFVIATSRSWKSISQEIEKYNIECDYVICNAGAIIIDPKKNSTIYSDFLKQEYITKIEEILKKQSDAEVTRFTEDDGISKNGILGYKIKGDRIILSNIMNEIKQTNMCLQIIYSNENKLFINGTSAKEDAIEEIYKLVNEPINIVTVGDDKVDIGMIKKYDGYRMKNSSEEVKKATNKEIENVYDII